MKRVLPKTFLIGYTTIDTFGISEYLKFTCQEDFLDSLDEGINQNLSDGEMICSFYAKLCYKSLVLGKNANVSKIRDISNNFGSIIKSCHGAVLEHFGLNFVTTNCSRVFTHELVRHRVGTAYSQTSGRYVALGVQTDQDGNECPAELEMVLDPLLDPAMKEIEEWADYTADVVRKLRQKLLTKDMPFDKKKKITSAIRRLAPNGQSNEIGFTLNLRSLRHLIELRTSRHAEWEIRLIFNQVANIILEKWPDILCGYKSELFDDMSEYTNLRV